MKYAGLVIGAFEDNDDTDDTTTGSCEWVLSFRDKSKLCSLALKPAAAKSATPRALIGAGAKTGAGEDAVADAAATGFCRASCNNYKERWTLSTCS